MAFSQGDWEGDVCRALLFGDCAFEVIKVIKHIAGLTRTLYFYMALYKHRYGGYTNRCGRKAA